MRGRRGGGFAAPQQKTYAIKRTWYESAMLPQASQHRYNKEYSQQLPCLAVSSWVIKRVIIYGEREVSRREASRPKAFAKPVALPRVICGWTRGERPPADCARPACGRYF